MHKTVSICQGCANIPDTFCYICGELTFKPQRRKPQIWSGCHSETWCVRKKV